MSDDIVKKLRGKYAIGPNAEFGYREFYKDGFIPPINEEAAKTIEQLRAENERLKQALTRVHAMYLLNPPHINQCKAMAIIAQDAINWEPDNDE